MVSATSTSNLSENTLVVLCVENVKIGSNPEHKIKIKRYFKLNLLWGCSIVVASKISQFKL
jgi:hypothetical protein